jgi:RHS repeat-associated protein
LGGPASSANATDAQYTVTYEGGSSTVTVNQRVNGGQWVLLGTYPFNAAGTGYKVDLADTSLTGKVVADAIYYVQDGAPVDSFTWTPDIQAAGDYQLYARWTASSANSGAAQYTVVHDGGTSLVAVSQKQNGGQWNLLGTWSFASGAGHQVTLTASSDGNVVADAIKLVGTGPAPADLVYLHTDQIGLPQKITDAMQAVVWDRVQDPFGRQVSLTSSGGIDTALRFPGQQADPDAGFAYNYFRDYDPTLGRYVQADPIGLAGGINPYAYAKSNPIRFTDELGLDPDGYGTGSADYPYYPGVFDVFIPGTPANDAFVHSVLQLFKKIEKACSSNDKPCPPCRLKDGTIVAVGAIAYRFDKLPSSVIQHGIAGSHLNLYKANQNPNNCQCFWQPVGAVPPPPQPNWIPIQPFAN